MSREWGKGYVVNTGINPATPESTEMVDQVRAAYTAKEQPMTADNVAEIKTLRKERDEFERRMKGYQSLGLMAIFLADIESDDPVGELRAIRDEWLEEKTRPLREERDRLQAAITNAPHGHECMAGTYDTELCHCWKARLL